MHRIGDKCFDIVKRQGPPLVHPAPPVRTLATPVRRYLFIWGWGWEFLCLLSTFIRMHLSAQPERPIVLRDALRNTSLPLSPSLPPFLPPSLPLRLSFFVSRSLIPSPSLSPSPSLALALALLLALTLSSFSSSSLVFNLDSASVYQFMQSSIERLRLGLLLVKSQTSRRPDSVLTFIPPVTLSDSCEDVQWKFNLKIQLKYISFKFEMMNHFCTCVLFKPSVQESAAGDRPAVLSLISFNQLFEAKFCAAFDRTGTGCTAHIVSWFRVPLCFCVRKCASGACCPRCASNLLCTAAWLLSNFNMTSAAGRMRELQYNHWFSINRACHPLNNWSIISFLNWLSGRPPLPHFDVKYIRWCGPVRERAHRLVVERA